MSGLFSRARSYWRGLRRPEQLWAEMDEEMRFHIEMEAERLVREQGLEPPEARRQAALAFGGVERYKEEGRDARTLGWVDALLQDSRYGGRVLAKSRGFAVVAALTIAIGVGATTAIFSVTNAVLLRPLPVSDPGSLFLVQEQRLGSMSSGSEGRRIPYDRYLEYRESTEEVFSGLAAQRYTGFSVLADGEAVAVLGALTSGNYFEVLGVRPQVGRFFTGDDEPVAVVSHRFWRGHLSEDPEVVGRTIHLNSQPVRVVGVAPRGFGGTATGVGLDVWVSMEALAPGEGIGLPASWVAPFGRLRPGVDPALAASVVDAVARRIPPEEPRTRVEGALLEPMTGMAGSQRGAITAFLGMLLATAGLVLFIASVNIAGMLLARGVARRREVAVRLAMGAARGRIVRQLLTETLLLFVLGGAAGILVALGGTWLLARVRLPGADILMLDLSPDGRVLGFALAVTAATGLLFGLVPALQASRPDLATALKGGGIRSGAGSTRGRSFFVAAQLAMSVLLLVTAGLFVRSLQRGLAVDPGFDPDGVVVAALNLAPHGYDEARGRAFYQQLVERVRALPGVENAALADVVLVSGNLYTGDIEAADPGSSGPVESSSAYSVVDTSYFETMRVELVAGRGFSAADAAGAPAVAVINETFARRLWPGGSPLGKRFRMAGTEIEVIGVARDGRYVALNEEPTAFAFLPFAQRYGAEMTLHVRARHGAEASLEGIRREVSALDRHVAVEQAMPLPALIGSSLFPQRFAASLIGIYGLVGLLLAGIGVYGVLAFYVAQRTREIGIRMALGARARSVLGLVVRRVALLGAAGAVAGLLLAAAVARLLEGLLFGVSPLDPATYALVALALVGVGGLASYFPARRAVRVDPMEALRAE